MDKNEVLEADPVEAEATEAADDPAEVTEVEQTPQVLVVPGEDRLKTEVHTSSGTIEIIHEITLGDAAIFTVLSLLLAFQIFRCIAALIWREKQ